MSTTSKVIMWVVIAVVVIGGGIWWWLSMSPTAVSPTTATSTSMNSSGTPQNNGVSATDNSNAALQADLSNIDSQMSGFSSDNASVTQSMNDQPVQQQSF